MLKNVKVWTERALLAVMASMLTIMVCLMLWQVFTRYALGVPALYTEETLRFLMIWMALLGAAYCFGAERHLALGLVPAMLAPGGQRVLYVFNALIVIVFAVVVLLLGGIKASQSAMSQVSPIMQIPIGYVYLILPLSAVLTCLLQGVNLFLVLTGRKRTPFDATEVEEV